MVQPWDEFEKCQFRPTVSQALLALGFPKPTLIQAQLVSGIPVLTSVFVFLRKGETTY